MFNFLNQKVSTILALLVIIFFASAMAGLIIVEFNKFMEARTTLSEF